MRHAIRRWWLGRAQARDQREQVRLQAARMFADGMDACAVAAALEVSTKSAYTWRRAWAAGGERALASNGAPGPALQH
ncbi:helix-turn-helix domain-containing protein [Actinoplanes sp. NPDC051513]|uniref:helix-turn-helix domain-containing protein n=1 Tax=Actinoplanes sp. NPDC051513 TaxID=3363908 RepID=UPI003793CE29